MASELEVGKIGIATSGSNRQLHVKNTSGDAAAEFEATAENNDAFVTFNTHGNTGYIGIDDSVDLLKINATSGLSSASHLAIDSAGNVGVGVTPTSNLHIQGADASANTQLHVHNNQTAAAAVLKLEGGRTADNDTAQVLFTNSGNNIAAVKAFRWGGNDVGEMRFSTAPNAGTGLVDRLTISSAGLCSFSAGITVSGGFTTLGNYSSLTIASGGITATSSAHVVDTEGSAATDNLNTINGGTTGSILILKSATGSRDITLQDGSDNLRMAGNFTLASSNDSITFMKVGTDWREISRSTN